MYPTALNFAVIGYVCATGLALAYLVQREELTFRLASLATLAGWAAHTVSLIAQAVALGRPPLGTLGEAVSVAVWVVVLLAMWVERQYALQVLGAFVLNFAGAIMYLLQERQLKIKRPGAFYYRLPALETLDRLTYRTLALGFPFLTVGLILGALWAGTAWGSVFTFDPMALFSFV